MPEKKGRETPGNVIWTIIIQIIGLGTQFNVVDGTIVAMGELGRSGASILFRGILILNKEFIRPHQPYKIAYCKKKQTAYIVVNHLICCKSIERQTVNSGKECKSFNCRKLF